MRGERGGGERGCRRMRRMEGESCFCWSLSFVVASSAGYDKTSELCGEMLWTGERDGEWYLSGFAFGQ